MSGIRTLYSYTPPLISFLILLFLPATEKQTEEEPITIFSGFRNVICQPAAAKSLTNTHTKNDEISMQEAIKLRDAGKPDAALKVLDLALEKNALSEPLHTLRADLRNEMHNQEGAVADLNQSITLSPQKVELFNKRARIFLRVSQLQAAEYDINHAFKLQPDNNETLALRGGLYFKLNRHDKALQDLNKAISRDKNNALAYFYRGAVEFRLKNFKSAIEDYTTAIKLNPSNLAAYQSRGCAYGETGEYKAALADFNIAAQNKAETSHIYFNRGRVYRLMGDYTNAIKEFNTAIRCGLPEQDSAVPVFLERASVYLGMGRTDQAMIDVNHYLKSHGRDPRAYILRAQIYKQMGNVAAELKDSARAKELGATVGGVRPSVTAGK